MAFESIPFQPPYAPMEMRQVAAFPEGTAWLYEPKWDGFQCLAFRDGADVALYSKSGQPLGRYFLEIVAALLRLVAARFVLDSELIIPLGQSTDFDSLLQRIHPAASRVSHLAKTTPSQFQIFDMLVDEDGRSLVSHPLEARRTSLEAFSGKYLSASSSLALSPATRNANVAQNWYATELTRFDGIVAKDLRDPYGSGTRSAAVKFKRKRTADCVVGGFRYAKDGRTIASLLLGLFDDDGLFHHVGFLSGMDAKLRAQAKTLVEPLIEVPGFTGRAPGGPSRWRRTEEPWHPLRAALVVEISTTTLPGPAFAMPAGSFGGGRTKRPRLVRARSSTGEKFGYIVRDESYCAVP